MVTREDVISNIRRMAALNGGRAPGKATFEKATGIRESAWAGRYWATWGDAVREAGLEPNALQGKTHTNDELADHLGELALRLGHFPTATEIRLEKRENPAFPAANSLTNRLGKRDEMLATVFQRAVNMGRSELVTLLASQIPQTDRPPSRGVAPSVPGRVYLLKSGNYFKIGKTDNLQQRINQIQLAVPEPLREIHVLETDDPAGIEAYWHRRFATKRVKGEWFVLEAGDVDAFKRRGHFM